jgi:hypothetical protein
VNDKIGIFFYLMNEYGIVKSDPIRPILLDMYVLGWAGLRFHRPCLPFLSYDRPAMLQSFLFGLGLAVSACLCFRFRSFICGEDMHWAGQRLVLN